MDCSYDTPSFCLRPFEILPRSIQKVFNLVTIDPSGLYPITNRWKWWCRQIQKSLPHPHCMFIASVDHHYSGSGPIIQWQSCGSSVHPFLSRALIGTMSHCSFFILLKKQGLGRLRGGLQGSFDTPPFLSFSILNYFNKALLYIALASM